jgi:hypothetical protein
LNGSDSIDFGLDEGGRGNQFSIRFHQFGSCS